MTSLITLRKLFCSSLLILHYIRSVQLKNGQLSSLKLEDKKAHKFLKYQSDESVECNILSETHTKNDKKVINIFTYTWNYQFCAIRKGEAH